ncbi:MAG: hypothetical protein NTU74_19070, partial [Deltaproteobacteria bacterium]|nr:hypothetical protein [Deltaproteobacteria bacterium]
MAIILIVAAWGFPVPTAMAATSLAVTQVTWNSGDAAVKINGSGAGSQQQVLFLNAATRQQIGSTRSQDNGTFAFVKQGLNPAPCQFIIKGYDGKTITTGYTSNPPAGCTKTTTYSISASAGANGAISPSGSVSVSQGASRAFTITANTGYKVQSVLVDGTSVGAVTSYSFSNVTANHTISATFAANTT